MLILNRDYIIFISPISQFSKLPDQIGVIHKVRTLRGREGGGPAKTLLARMGMEGVSFNCKRTYAIIFIPDVLQNRNNLLEPRAILGVFIRHFPIALFLICNVCGSLIDSNSLNIYIYIYITVKSYKIIIRTLVREGRGCRLRIYVRVKVGRS